MSTGIIHIGPLRFEAITEEWSRNLSENHNWGTTNFEDNRIAIARGDIWAMRETASHEIDEAIIQCYGLAPLFVDAAAMESYILASSMARTCTLSRSVWRDDCGKDILATYRGGSDD